VNEDIDCLIIGGGPAGLTAANYLGRFRRRVLVVDGGWSRAEWISRSHNLAGFPEGIAGPVFLEHMREQARRYGAPLRKGYVSGLRRTDDGLFTAQLESGEAVTAMTVILATGVVENKPPVQHLADAVNRGLIRTCPICDGYESTGKRIGVLGNSGHAASEALFLRTYTANLSLLMVSGSAGLPTDTKDALDVAGIDVRHVGSGSVKLEDSGVSALCGDNGETHSFDIIYTAFGTTSQAALAKSLGARMDANNRLYVGVHQETSVNGLYAAGDLVRGLNQISVANGEAAIAATAVHNRLPNSWLT
jgi:thioredoxin reductase (NADPH)